MICLLDTSVVMRLANTTDAANPTAERAVSTLHARGWTLCLCPQNLVEFRGAATRPAADNGLGLPAAEADRLAAIYETSFTLLPDTPDIHLRWTGLVAALAVIGKQVHDARLAAVCHDHAIPNVLTFNVRHFARLATHPPGLTVLHPATV